MSHDSADFCLQLITCYGQEPFEGKHLVLHRLLPFRFLLSYNTLQDEMFRKVDGGDGSLCKQKQNKGHATAFVSTLPALNQ
jgi:hypothetical protein